MQTEPKIRRNKVENSNLNTLSSVSVTGYLIANLGAADLCVGVVCIPFTLLYYELGYWPFGLVLCKIIPVVQPLSVLASIGTLAAIAAGEFDPVHQRKSPTHFFYKNQVISTYKANCS